MRSEQGSPQRGSRPPWLGHTAEEKGSGEKCTRAKDTGSQEHREETRHGKEREIWEWDGKKEKKKRNDLRGTRQ